EIPLLARPKRGETDEELLRMQDDFLKSGGKPSVEVVRSSKSRDRPEHGDAANRGTPSNASKPPPQVEASATESLSDVSLASVLCDVVGPPPPVGHKSLFALRAKRSNSSSGPRDSDVPQTSSGPVSNGGALAPSDREAIHAENLERLQNMSHAEKVQARDQLLARLDESELPIRPSEAAQRWLHMDQVEEEKLEWMTMLPPAKEPDSKDPIVGRFDFEGNLVSPSAEIPTHRGLHHHGDSPQHWEGHYAGLLAETDLADHLLGSGLAPLLRSALDDRSTLDAALAALRALVVSRPQEEVLKRAFLWCLGHRSPFLQPAKRVESTNELTDLELSQADIVKALLRMDLLTRLSYVLRKCCPGANAVASTLLILARMARHSLQSATKMIVKCMGFGPKENKDKFFIYTVKSAVKAVMSGKMAQAYGSPMWSALELVRSLAAAGRSLADTLLQRYPLEESLSAYLALDPRRVVVALSEIQRSPNLYGTRKLASRLPGSDCLCLALEAVRTWRVLLAYELAGGLCLALFPVVARRLQLCSCFELDGEAFDLEYGACLLHCLATLPAEVAREAAQGLGSILESCCGRWADWLARSDRAEASARTPPSSRSTSPNPSSGGPDEDQIETRSSRRTQGLQPEYRPLPPKTKPTRRTTMVDQSQTPVASAVVYLPVAPRTPTPFHGESHEDVEDWLQQYERVACHNQWTPEQCLQNVYFALEGTARTWFENHEASISSWQDFQAELRRTFASQQRRQRAEELLQARSQEPNESVTSFVEDVLRLMNRADPNAPEEKKLRFLMRGVKETIFGGLVRNPPITVQDCITEATNLDCALQARASHYQRLPDFTALSPYSSNTPDIRKIIRNVVRVEIKKLLPATHQPASVSIAEVVREEVQRAFQPEAPASVAAPEEPSLTYAAVARRPAPAAQQYSTPPRRILPEPQTFRRREGATRVRPALNTRRRGRP
ncbi:hypothetical protein HPB47_017400, partial [Ixodes persulcatus]